MSLFSWFSRKPAPPKPRPAAEPSGLLNADATVPLSPGRLGKPLLEPVPPEHAANRKNERMERRELLYTVVRDAMVRAGVLSASYKFKVLSLDQRGRQFLVMMDLAREYGGETVRLSEIEALIAQTAKTRYDILVTAVYWRINDHVAVGIPQKGVAPLGASLQAAPAPAVRRPAPVLATPAPAPAPAPAAMPARAAAAPVPAAPAPAPAVRPAVAAPAPAASAPAAAVPPVRPAAPTLAAQATAPAPLLPAAPTLAPAPAPATRPSPRYEPIEADEVAAFKRALANAAGASAAAPAAAAAARPGVPVRSGPLLPPSSHSTGFEDTEMPGSDGPSPDLSSTQYGELN
ncbi:hypothetical protein ASF11_03125 [Acidovorax sp. Leaf76]|uniref:hypothetical protein n=1 Tax=unclassified Acidovorax TaxID=2684926 RepID=UPI0006F84191|nr:MULTISPECIES: hypothetical protein [unclassified Acidovorax]KQO26686.1 hypothetical protein ASF11_03125 [Acidovorax sp. Leaf76]KQO40459.1 hypothetical protein ASF19_02165 [Acidovorax sp. Leaf84]KQS42599.1 hypothetical protein ASG27_02100 [Acidovorax sp. Leaf191]